ncbi:MAG: hypothetical protein QW809_07330 [Sulfolobales archaeon]
MSSGLLARLRDTIPTSRSCSIYGFTGSSGDDSKAYRQTKRILRRKQLSLKLEEVWQELFRALKEH